ncbi:BadM/Rrf2 family transcriptional regulator [Breoghania corrubedonensis]|uniref:BadM/Rrf2 family transcriptional regulator n=1 Tax=Breoghania corrubedonensis TaxID=665038 RepID=A0A2T5V1B9_9HYPH|nr:Rrf2 family transcriptional regulator [Breoghania corrubedonensis]PTW57555.1 BadM/Rrf2 family transcriptional regulator [Breoghania corrubedonensis]
MKVTQFTDFSLRLLMYLAQEPDRLVTIGEVAEVYGISSQHLKKVAQSLSGAGLVKAVPGKKGGLRLACSPTQINLGQLIRRQENLTLLDCAACPLKTCKLTRLFDQGLSAFLDVFDGKTLADIV